MKIMTRHKLLQLPQNFLHNVNRCQSRATVVSGIQDNSESVAALAARQAWEEEATIYVHWPYCERRCTYCNFNKYVKKHIDEERMQSCLVKETKTLLELSGVRKIKSVFFGGGTPSLAMPSTLNAVLNTVAQKCQLLVNAEVTMEANPNSIETDKLWDFKFAGINRVSLGIQALDASDLKVLGRDHSVEDSLRCLDVAKTLFPGRTSLDLIFGRPNQTVTKWTEELEKILPLADDHISLYELTLERGTALFKQVMNGELTVPDADTKAEMYETSIKILRSHGFDRYEVSNFAREGAASDHNKSYWQGVQYIGVGPGAHGRFIPKNTGATWKEARIQTLEPDPWMYEVERYGHGTRKIVKQTTRDILDELLLVSMRTKNGLHNKTWQMFCDSSLQDVFSSSSEFQQLIKDGALELTNQRLRAMPSGMTICDSIVPVLMNVLQDYLEQKKIGVT